MKSDKNIEKERANWDFGGDVPKNFVEHVRRSVPGYDEGHELICQLSDFFCLNSSVCYELGTSTGQLLQRLSVHNSHKPGIRWIGIDTEAKMVELASDLCKQTKNIEVLNEDARLFDFEKSDFIVSYLTVQFIPPKDRQAVLNKIYDSLNWGGAFILFEKVRGPDARFQDIISNLYTNFKLKNEFAPEEILNKTEQIKGVMEPFSSEGNHQLLERAGFVDVMPFYRNICFEGLLCIK